jgi:rod shape-determining protein MreB
MIGRTPGNIAAVHPLRQGVISDYTITERMLRYFIQKAVGRLSFRKPRVCICVPTGLTEVERRAVEDAAYQAGARDVIMVEEPIAAAIGAGIDFTKPSGNMIVDIGGGSCNVAILSMDGVVVSNSVKIGGDDFDEALIRYVRSQFGVVIEQQAAEEIKMQIGTVYEKPEELFMEFISRDIETGLPKKVRISSEDCRFAFRELTGRVVEAVHSVLERTPPELSADIFDFGIVLVGGTALLPGIDQIIRERTGIRVIIPNKPRPRDCVCVGMGRMLQSAGGDFSEFVRYKVR